MLLNLKSPSHKGGKEKNMKIARNANLNTYEKEIAKQFIAEDAFNQNIKELNSQLAAECRYKGLNIKYIEENGELKNNFLYKVGEKWYRIKTNKNGNICRCVWLCETLKGEEQQIGEYTEEVLETISDAGNIVVNGLGFSNGYGDGYNTVVVRKFKDYDKSHYHCRAEIYNADNITVVYPAEEVKVWKHDCTPNDYIWQGKARKLIFKGRKLWIIL